MKCVAVDRVRVLLANVDGIFYAIGDMCGHRRAPLSAGELDGYLVECPLHYAIFDVRTGKFVGRPEIVGGWRRPTKTPSRWRIYLYR